MLARTQSECFPAGRCAVSSISKTDYILWRACAKNAWLRIHKPDVYYSTELTETYLSSPSSVTGRFFRSGPSLPVVVHRDPVRATIAAVFHLVKAGRAKDRMTSNADCGRVRVPLIEPDHPGQRILERGQPIARNDFGSPFVGNHADAARPRHLYFGLDAVLERLPNLSDVCGPDPVEYTAVDV